MGLEEEIKEFVIPYKILLWRMSKFINPYTTGKSKLIPDWKSLFEDKRKEFLDLFGQLQAPLGSSLVRTISQEDIYDVDSPVWHHPQYFCRDIIVVALDYESFKLCFNHINRKIDYSEQVADISLDKPMSGSTLDDEATIYFKKLIDLGWEHIKADFSKILPKPNEAGVCSYKSQHGLAECNYPIGYEGRFLSETGLKEGHQPIISFRVGGRSKNGGYSGIAHVDFNLKKLGYGELGAFLKHIGIEH